MSRVLVTGASKGIGRASVRELAARGHEVAATARSLAALQDLPAAARLALDVTDQESVDATLLSDDDPYRPLARQLAAARANSITVEEVAQAVADTLEDPDPPLRLPVGRPAATLLAARHATPDDVPFWIAPLRW